MMTDAQAEAALHRGRFIGLMSGVLFVGSVGLWMWASLLESHARFRDSIIFAALDCLLIWWASRLGKWVARSLLISSTRWAAIRLGVIGGLVFVLGFVLILVASGGIASGEFLDLRHLQWPNLESVAGVLLFLFWSLLFGGILACPWGIITSLCIRRSLAKRGLIPSHGAR